MTGITWVLQPWTDHFNPTMRAILLGYGMSSAYGFLLMLNVLIISHYNYLHHIKNQTVAIFWMSLTATIFSLCISLAAEELFIPDTIMDWMLVFWHCGTYGIILSLDMYVCSRLPGVVISLIGGTSVIYMCLAQYTFLSHIHSGNRNVLELCGVALVLLSSLMPPVVQYVNERNNNERG